MGNLRSELQVLVHSPSAPPPPVGDLAVRAAGIRRRAWLAGGGVALAATVLSVAALVIPGGPRPTQVVVGGGGPASAGYVAKAPGGYEATGEWRITIRRGYQIIDLRSGHAPFCRSVGFIRPGDEVRGWVYGEASTLKAGDAAGC